MSGLTYKVPPRSRVDIREITIKLRKIFDVKTPYFPIMEIVEFKLYKLISDYQLQVVDCDEMGLNHGLTFPDDNIIQLREDVYLGAHAGKARDRFTVAHELGHLILHKDINVGFARSAREDIKAFESSEWQANCFGGELLVSANHVLATDTPIEIANKFGVSMDAARKQYEELKKLGVVKK